MAMIGRGRMAEEVSRLPDWRAEAAAGARAEAALDRVLDAARADLESAVAALCEALAGSGEAHADETRGRALTSLGEEAVRRRGALHVLEAGIRPMVRAALWPPEEEVRQGVGRQGFETEQEAWLKEPGLAARLTEAARRGGAGAGAEIAYQRERQGWLGGGLVLRIDGEGEGAKVVPSFCGNPRMGPALAERIDDRRLVLERLLAAGDDGAWLVGGRLRIRLAQHPERPRMQLWTALWLEVDPATGEVAGAWPEVEDRLRVRYEPGARAGRGVRDGSPAESSIWGRRLRRPGSERLGRVRTQDFWFGARDWERAVDRMDRGAGARARRLLALATASPARRALARTVPEEADLRSLRRIAERGAGGGRIVERLESHPGAVGAVLAAPRALWVRGAEAIEANAPLAELQRLVRPPAEASGAGGGEPEARRRWMEGAAGLRAWIESPGRRTEEPSTGAVAKLAVEWMAARRWRVGRAYAAARKAAATPECMWLAAAAPQAAATLLAERPEVLAQRLHMVLRTLRRAPGQRNRRTGTRDAPWEVLCLGGALWRTARGEAPDWSPAMIPGLWDALGMLWSDVLERRVGRAEHALQAAAHVAGMGSAGIELPPVRGRILITAATDGGWGRVVRLCERLHDPRVEETRSWLRITYGVEPEPHRHVEPVGWTEAIRRAWPGARWIGCSQGLKEEGRQMGHCVGGYQDTVATQALDVFHLDTAGGLEEGTTLAVWERVDGGRVRYEVSQQAGRVNRDPREEDKADAGRLRAALQRAASEMAPEERRRRIEQRRAGAAEARERVERRSGHTLDPELEAAFAAELAQRVYAKALPPATVERLLLSDDQEFEDYCAQICGWRTVEALRIARGVWARWEREIEALGRTRREEGHDA